MKICYIIGSCEAAPEKIDKQSGDLIICADGGLALARNAGIDADIIVGDFDSLGEIPEGDNVIVHPREKDWTDSHLAIDIGLERGYRNFHLYGMLGGRLDHTLANIQLLVYLCENEANAVLYGNGYTVTAIKNSRLDLSKAESGIVSVFSFTPKSNGVTISGLKYQLNDFTLRADYPMGVSNEFTGKPAYIQVKDGTLIIVIYS